MEIADGIHRIKCRFGNNRMVYCHLLAGEEGALLIDTGCAPNPQQDILPYMAQINVDPSQLKYIVISHSDLDHQGGNAPMKAIAPSAVLMCHLLDEPWVADTEALISGRYSQFEADHGIGYGEAGKQGIREACLSAPVDLTLSGGETLRLGRDWTVEIVHTPGHTWGHLAVYDPRSKTLISGEASIWTSILDENWEPALPPTYCYVDTYLATQDRLLSMDIDLLSAAHWPVQKGVDVADFIGESRNFCLNVERKLLQMAGERPSYTLREAIETVGPTLGGWPAAANQDFSYGMAGNLHSLVKRGLLKSGRNEEGLVEWSLV
jgi:glyoxylase-like metal-dependent hydrolase (beta-lactamase superfamily II)